MKLSNVWKAYLSSLIGLLLPIVTGIISDLISGHIDWVAVKTSLVPAAVLLVTDLMKEAQSCLSPTDTTTTTTDSADKKA